MFTEWLQNLKRGLSERKPRDSLADEKEYSGFFPTLKKLQPFLSGHWKKIALGAGLFLSASLISFPQPLITKYLIDEVILARRLHLLAPVVLLLAAIYVLARVLGIFQQFFFQKLEQTITLDIQKDLYDRVLRLPLAFFNDKETGYLMSRLSTDVGGVRWFFSSAMITILYNGLRFSGGIVFLFYLQWKLALTVLIILPVVVFFVRYFSGKIHALAHRSMEQQAAVSSRLQEMLAAIPLIKAFSSEDRTASRLVSEVRSGQRISLEQSAVGAVANISIGILPDIAKGAVLLAGAYWIIKGDWTLGALFAFQAYLAYVFGPIRFFASSTFQFHNAFAALERVSVLRNLASEENVGTGRKIDHLKGDVTFQNVSFSYDGRDMALKNLSFHSRPGDKTGIVGPSGVGKTTLLTLLLCFYKPAEGQILFDGKPVSYYEIRSLRNRIGYVSQATLLLSGTILENLRYGNPDATQEQIEAAARAAGIDRFIQSLPEKYGAIIGEKGVNLSEGQKQRLSIARALVRNPDILILDEPTASLDSVTEQSIFKTLPEIVKGKTLFVASHRLSTLKDMDRILVLDENGAFASGTHESLMAQSNYYRLCIEHQGYGGPGETRR